MDVSSLIIKLLSTLTLGSDIFIVLALCYLLYSRFSGKKIKIASGFHNNLGKNALFFIFLVSLTATSGSLFFSEILHFEPCKLCWFQRIFMYPQVVISGLALIKKEKNLIKYSTALSIIGGLIAAYHVYIQTFDISTVCSPGSVSCGTKFILDYGYVTLPIMAFTAFLLIIILSCLGNKRKAI